MKRMLIFAVLLAIVVPALAQGGYVVLPNGQVAPVVDQQKGIAVGPSGDVYVIDNNVGVGPTGTAGPVIRNQDAPPSYDYNDYGYDSYDVDTYAPSYQEPSNPQMMERIGDTDEYRYVD